MKFSITILLFCILTNSIAQISNNEDNQDNISLIQHDKNPGVAFLLSALVPGTGQMYNGQVSSGLIIFFTEALLAGFIQYDLENSELNNDLDLVMALAFSGVYIGAIINAPLYSMKWNKMNGFLTNNNLKFDMGINPLTKSIGIRLYY